VPPVPPARSRTDRGSTLVEVLAVAVLLVVVLLGVLSVLDTAARSVPRDVEWTHAIGEVRVGVATMVREVRQADVVHGATPNRIDFELSAGGTPRRVMYSCDVAAPEPGLRRCTRVSAASGGALPDPATGSVVVDRVRNGTLADPVFDLLPDPVAPRHVGVRILVPASGERPEDGGRTHPVVIEDGAYLRNRDAGR
jgi:hypothetical protein